MRMEKGRTRNAIIIMFIVSVVATFLSIFRTYKATYIEFIVFSFAGSTSHLSAGRPAPFLLFPYTAGGILFIFYGFIFDIAFWLFLLLFSFMSFRILLRRTPAIRRTLEAVVISLVGAFSMTIYSMLFIIETISTSPNAIPVFTSGFSGPVLFYSTQNNLPFGRITFYYFDVIGFVDSLINFTLIILSLSWIYYFMGNSSEKHSEERKSRSRDIVNIALTVVSFLIVINFIGIMYLLF